jgi:dolichyl-phosphate-mannose-protein mannosyltransferase
LVTLKSNIRGGGLLHSHIQKYPLGSEQQQITTYSHKDSNNNWIVELPWGAEELPNTPVKFVQDGDIIRLKHSQTLKNLHCHEYPAPITSSEWEVSGYGSEKIGDYNDHWIIQKVEVKLL